MSPDLTDFERCHARLRALSLGLTSDIHGFRELMLKIAAEPEHVALCTVLLTIGAATVIDAEGATRGAGGAAKQSTVAQHPPAPRDAASDSGADPAVRGPGAMAQATGEKGPSTHQAEGLPRGGA